MSSDKFENPKDEDEEEESGYFDSVFTVVVTIVVAVIVIVLIVLGLNAAGINLFGERRGSPFSPEVYRDAYTGYKLGELHPVHSGGAREGLYRVSPDVTPEMRRAVEKGYQKLKEKRVLPRRDLRGYNQHVKIDATFGDQIKPDAPQKGMPQYAMMPWWAGGDDVQYPPSHTTSRHR